VSERELEISKNFKKIYAEIGETKLIAVTKYSPISDIIISMDLGHLDYGENRVDQLKERSLQLIEAGLLNARWHMIGHLQTNKVKEVLSVPNLYAIHSVDSLRLVHEIIKRIDDFAGDRLNIFLQFNTSNEEEKSGFLSYSELKEAAQIVLSHKKLNLYGLMTMGSIRSEDQINSAKECFSKLASIKEELIKDLNLPYLNLSMGMSADYQIAILHGANYIRLGSVLYKNH
jgi:pyridoxal phosphate enzyme (YggS family)